MLNENKIKGNWQELKGKIQKAWGKLTDDELERTKGDLKQISGLVQKRYGETEAKVRERLNSFGSKHEGVDHEFERETPEPTHSFYAGELKDTQANVVDNDNIGDLH